MKPLLLLSICAALLGCAHRDVANTVWDGPPLPKGHAISCTDGGEIQDLKIHCHDAGPTPSSGNDTIEFKNPPGPASGNVTSDSTHLLNPVQKPWYGNVTFDWRGATICDDETQQNCYTLTRHDVEYLHNLERTRP